MGPTRSDPNAPLPPRIAVDAEQALTTLRGLHHWAATKRCGGRVQVTIKHAGRRVTAERADFVSAVAAAIDKLHDVQKGPRLRLVGRVEKRRGTGQRNNPVADAQE